MRQSRHFFGHRIGFPIPDWIEEHDRPASFRVVDQEVMRQWIDAELNNLGIGLGVPTRVEIKIRWPVFSPPIFAIVLQQIGASRQHVSAVQSVIVFVEYPLPAQHGIISQLIPEAEEYVVREGGEARFGDPESRPHGSAWRHGAGAPPAKEIPQGRSFLAWFISTTIPDRIEVGRWPQSGGLSTGPVMEQRFFMRVQAVRGTIP